jgi:hypothetical protein
VDVHEKKEEWSSMTMCRSNGTKKLMLLILKMGPVTLLYILVVAIVFPMLTIFQLGLLRGNLHCNRNHRIKRALLSMLIRQLLAVFIQMTYQVHALYPGNYP